MVVCSILTRDTMLAQFVTLTLIAFVGSLGTHKHMSGCPLGNESALDGAHENWWAGAITLSSL